MRFEEWRLDSIWPVDLLARCLSGHRRAGHRIVLTNGCFDVLHRGHIECLQQAASLGDVLVVGVHSDESVRKLKGTGRPVSPVEDRAAVVAAIGCVEYVTIFDETTPLELLEAVRPDIYVKGGDYDGDMLPERLAVEIYGGRVATVGYLPGRSTAGLVERIRGTADPARIPADHVNHRLAIGPPGRPDRAGWAAGAGTVRAAGRMARRMAGPWVETGPDAWVGAERVVRPPCLSSPH